jgi:GTPase SAR1 family protein
VGQIDQRIIAIIGGSNTGKSHYIATLIHRLEHEVGANFHFGVSKLGDETRDRWVRDFEEPLFKRRMVLQPTQRAELNTQVKKPLIFRLTLDQGNSIRELNLSFFDTAGEDMTFLAVDALSVEARYITQADGIIVLLDPLQIETVRQQLPEVNIPSPDPSAQPAFIVARLRELFEHRLNIPASKKIKIPIAFTLSKVDTLWPILAPDSALLRHSEHFGELDTDDVQSVSTEVSSYLKTWINLNFSEEIRLKFANYRYFGVSSLGEQPDAHNRLSSVNPLRVEDPFLWILYQLGLIKGKKGR